MMPRARVALGVLIEPAAVALDNARRMAQAEALSVTDDLTRLYNAALPEAGADPRSEARGPLGAAAVRSSSWISTDSSR